MFFLKYSCQKLIATGSLFVNGSQDYVPVPGTSLYDQPEFLQKWIERMMTLNAKVLKKVSLFFRHFCN